MNLWDGPGQVVNVESDTRVVVLLPSRIDPRRELTVHPDRLRKYEVPFAQPWNRDGAMLRFPVKLLRRRQHCGEMQYKVRWLSVRPTPDTWTSASQLPPHLIDAYEWSRAHPTALMLIELLEN